MRFLHWIFIACFFLTAKVIQAQVAVYPNTGTIFNGNLNTIHILIHPDSLVELLKQDNRWSNHSYPATFVYNGTDTVKQIGIRLKGNTARNSRKLSYKLEIDEFVNQNYQGLKTFNLNGNTNDPSLSREFLSAYVMQKSGVACLRVNQIKLFINGVFEGVYSLAEQVDKTFLNSRLNENDGNLYKCNWPADLRWIDDNQLTYKNIINPSPLNERAYDLKTNKGFDDYAGLVHFIKVVNRSTAGAFEKAIDSVFEVDAYLKTLAAEMLIGHWDNYFVNKNNYYLYQQTNGKFIYLPYDMDNTYGVQWGLANIATRSIQNWGSANPLDAQLTHRILAIPAYKKQLEIYLKQLCTTVFNADSLYPVVDLVKQTLADAIAIDPYYNGSKPSDYGFTITDWQNAFTQPTLSHVSYGIKPYIAQRCSSALAQIPPNTGLFNHSQELFVKPYPNPANQAINLGVAEACLVTSYNQQGLVMGSYFTNQVNCANWSNGIYVLKITQAGNTQFIKVVVNHNE